MEFKHIDTLPGSPKSSNIFEPHMPDVDLLSDMDGFFVHVRKMLETENTDEYIRNAGLGTFVSSEKAGQRIPKGQRHVAVITPGRMVSLAPAPIPNTVSEKDLVDVRFVLPSEVPLQITAISYTKLEAYMADTSKTKCIPFLGFLLAFAYLGHNVIVFEGHPSALEFGVRNSDVLFIDSAMLPFMGDNWAEVVFKVMKPNPKIYLHERKNYQLIPIVRKNSPPGWRYSEPDGEASYANILLTTLVKAGYKNRAVNIVSGQPLPNPKEFTTDPEELDYISSLPFKYDKLNADMVIKILWDHGKPANFLDSLQSTRIFKARLAESGGRTRDVSFQLKLSKTSNGKQQLEIGLS